MEPLNTYTAENFSELPRYSLAKKKADSLTAGFRSPPIPVHDLIEHNGLDVVFADFGSFKDDVAGLIDFAEAKLLINRDDPVNRQRFTMAHEFGHWMLHRELYAKDPEVYAFLPRYQMTADEDSVIEKEANAFAANLLVPLPLLRKVQDEPLSWLARIFMVSETVIGFRLKHL